MKIRMDYFEYKCDHCALVMSAQEYDKPGRCNITPAMYSNHGAMISAVISPIVTQDLELENEQDFCSFPCLVGWLEKKLRIEEIPPGLTRPKWRVT